MRRDRLFTEIETRLNLLALRINSRGRLNILNLHGHSENFYQYLLNRIYGWSSRNANDVKQNVESIDLIDDGNKLVIQVSATASKQKIESSLSKDSLAELKGYTFKFVSIANDADNLRKKTFKNPHGIGFNPTSDIIDKNWILTKIRGAEIGDLESICELVRKELSGEVDPLKLESNLAAVINILYKEDWNKSNPISETRSFEIKRKIDHNSLNGAKGIINDYGVHHGRVDSIFAEFDSQGSNRSTSVLSAIRQEYVMAKKELSDDQLFFDIVKRVEERVLSSSNYTGIPVEELEMCINILIVDAFMRCKIFENPEKL